LIKEYGNRFCRINEKETEIEKDLVEDGMNM
jgi:hypothetical protein